MDAAAMHTGNERQTGEPLVFGKYAALVVDVLGQSTELAKFKEDYNPYDKDDHHEVVQLLKNTSGTVMWLASLFESTFDGYISSAGVSDYEKYINDSTFDYSLYKKNTRIAIQKQYFSDTLLFYFPLFGPNDMVYVGRISTLVLAVAAVQIMSMAEEVPIRGAIEIGDALYTPPIGLYGPLLGRAHHYESRVAGGPRIIVGEQCLRFLECMKNLPQTSTYYRILRMEAATTLLQICKDTDGCEMIDFLGPFMAQTSSDFPNMKLGEVVAKAYHFINASKQRHRSEIQTKGEEAEKLYRRYDMLCQYMRGRKDEFWDRRRKGKR